MRGGVIIGLGARLQVFQNASICDITAQDGLTSADRDRKNARSSVSAAIRIVPLTSLSSLFFRSCLLSWCVMPMQRG